MLLQLPEEALTEGCALSEHATVSLMLAVQEDCLIDNVLVHQAAGASPKISVEGKPTTADTLSLVANITN